MSTHRILQFADNLEDSIGVVHPTEARWRKYVTFRLDRENYAFAITTIQEVVRVDEIVRVPHAPYAVKGICNLRGRVVPVVDLRVRLGLGHTEVGAQSRILITTAHNRLLGLLVDEVGHVEMIDELRIDAPPADILTEHSEYITGVYQQDPLFLIVLDAERALLLPEGLEARNTHTSA